MLSAAQIVRHAVRRLGAAPTFTVACILTLALGIGATTTVFTMVNGVLLQPLPYDRADRLVDLAHTLAIPGALHVDQSDATYLLYRRDNHVFADVGAYRSASVNLVDDDASSAGSNTAMRTPAAFASASVFRVLRVGARMGRTIGETDDSPSAPPIAVVSWQLWQRAFGGDRAIVGRRVTIDGVLREVVGVMPPTFHFPSAETAVWLPLALDPANIKSAAFDYQGVARLRDGVTLAAAQADMQRILPHVPEAFPGRLTVSAISATHMQAIVRPLRDVIIGDVGRTLWIVLGAVGVLLAIACANVSNLFLARAESRHRELGVRRALGASRMSLLADFVSEAAIVALVGGLVGLLLAEVGVAMLRQTNAAAAIPRLDEVHIDALVVLVTVGLAAVAALMVSALPVARVNTVPLSIVLATGNRSATVGRGRHRVRRALVVIQVALALVLLAAAGLFTRSFARLRSVDPGFATTNTVAFRMSIPSVTAPSTRDAAAIVARVQDAARGIPGVTAVGVVTKLPLDAEARQDSAVFMEDHPLKPGDIPAIREIAFATPGYFSAMSIPVIAGRLYSSFDPSGLPAKGPPEVVVSEALAKRYWGTTQAIGKRIKMNAGDPWQTIVGVVGSVHDEGLDQSPTEEVYCPLVTLSAARVPWIPRDLAFVVHTRGDASTLATEIQRVVGSSAPAIPTYHLTPLAELVSSATARTTFTLIMLAIAGLAATLIGAVGIYGVISYLVNLRTREIGVRIALGADVHSVRRYVTSQALRDALIGVAIGLVVAVIAGRSLGAVLFDVQPTDPLTLAAVSVVLLATAFAASWLPARRASTLDPAIALRND